MVASPASQLGQVVAPSKIVGSMHRAVAAQDKRECGSGSSYGDGGVGPVLSLAELLPPDGSGDPSHFETGPSGPLENILGIAAGPDLFLALRHGLHGAMGLRHDQACR